MRLLLHIGHGKTGSSYLQSWLATNTNSLALQSGLLYPTKSSDNFFLEDRASQGRFSMGNGHVLQALLDSSIRPRRWRRKLLDKERVSRRQLNGLVFSFEGWAKQLDQLLPPLLPVADRWGVKRIELLLMVRDPLEHACSVYSQMVKRHGYTADFEQWLFDYGFMARLLKSGGNVLLLDEPTNDLDVETLRALEDALVDFAGCAVVISHDRFFLDRICTHILAFEGEAHVEWFEGNFEDYEEDKKRRLGADALEPKRIKHKKKGQ